MNKNEIVTLILTALLILYLCGFSIVESSFPRLIPPPPYNVDAIAVWSHNTSDPFLKRDIYYSIYDDSHGFWWTMEPPYIGMASPIATLDGDDLFPAIAFDHLGKAIAVWSHDTGLEKFMFEIYYSCWDPWFFQWTEPAPVNATLIEGNDWDPTITLWTDGTTGLVVWTRENGELWFSQWNRTSWIGPSSPLVKPWPPLYPSYLKQPEIAYDANRNAIVVWTDSDEEPPYFFRVWYSMFPYIPGDPTGWTYPQQIPGQTYDDVARTYRKGMSPDGFGKAKAVWGPESEFSWPIQYAYWNGSTFTLASNVTDDTWGIESAIAFDRANNAITTYRSDRECRQGDIWYNREVAGVWYPPSFAAGTKNNSISMNDDEPRIAFMLSGRAVAVWTALFPDTEIYYSIWKAPGFWTKPEPIASAIKHLPGDDGLWDGPVSIASNSGSPTAPVPPKPPQRVDAIAIWSHDTGNSTYLFDIYYSLYDDEAGVWWTLEDGKQVAPIANLTGNDTCPAISFDHFGRAIAVWSHETGGGYHDIYYSNWTGGLMPSWTDPVPVAETVGVDDLDPAIALWKDGTGAAIWVAYTPKGIPEIRYSIWNGTHWVGPAESLTWPNPWPPELGTWYKQPEIAYDNYHNAIAVWTDMAPCEVDHVYHSVLFHCAKSWTPPERIPGQPSYPYSVATSYRKGISPDRLGKAKAVWCLETPGLWPIQYAVWNGTAFDKASNITKEWIDLQSEPAVAFDQFDNATLVYHSVQLCWDDIWYSREVSDVWSTPTFAAGADGSFVPDVDPRIAQIICGRAVAVWTAVRSDWLNREMHYSVWDPLLNWTDAMPIASTGLPLADISVAIASNLGSPTTPLPLHDVAITSVKTDKTVVGQGYNCEINATIANEGDSIEIFNLLLYAQTMPPPSIIATITVSNLLGGENRTITFIWNTAGFALGNYTIIAYAEPVLGETDKADNTYIDGWVLITKVGDFGGGLPPRFFECDGVVDGADLALFIACYKKLAPPEAMYLADLGGGLPPKFYQCDGKVDGLDLALFIQCYKGLGP